MNSSDIERLAKLTSPDAELLSDGYRLSEIIKLDPASHIEAQDKLIAELRGLVSRLEDIELGARNLNAYLKWQLSPESPGYAPTFPSAVAHFRGQFDDWVFAPGHASL